MRNLGRKLLFDDGVIKQKDQSTVAVAEEVCLSD